MYARGCAISEEFYTIGRETLRMRKYVEKGKEWRFVECAENEFPKERVREGDSHEQHSIVGEHRYD